jgi:hypothetical protein
MTIGDLGCVCYRRRGDDLQVGGGGRSGGVTSEVTQAMEGGPAQSKLGSIGEVYFRTV